MKNLRIAVFLFLSTLSFTLLAQKHSWDGNSLKPEGKYHVLNIFINVIYDVNPDKNPCRDNTAYWDNAIKEGVNNEAIPIYLLDFMDTAYVNGKIHGTMTRLYGESSFDALQITGDFMIVNIRESRILRENNNKFNAFFVAETSIDYVNSEGGLKTLYGHDDISYYDHDNKGEIFFTQVLIRNLTAAYGGLNSGSGYGSSCIGSKYILIKDKYYKFSEIGTFQCVGASQISLNPSGIIFHEFSHSLFGSNAFHTSGGNHRVSRELMPFLTIQNGYGLMGAAGSSLVGCNAYERLRMHWKNPSSPDYISALDAGGNNYKKSDISKESGNQSFILRDFVTYGDAIRIKLPYKDSEKSSNQYIWLENHRIGQNNKLDFFQYSNSAECRSPGTPGIYAYYQIGRDVLSGQSQDVWFADERDNLKMIPAEGYYNYDIHFVDSAYNMRCINYMTHNYYDSREDANPFNGYQDQETHFYPSSENDVLKKSDEYYMWRKTVNSRIYDNLAILGDDFDAFSECRKINMSSNPSTCNTRVYYNYLDNRGNHNFNHNERNVRTTYLSGLSIEMIPQKNGNFLVNVRWDDYDITEDANWTGNIMLKESAFLKPGCSIRLTQNYTPEQPYRDTLTGLFAKSSVLVCENGSKFVMEANSSMKLDSKSKILLKSGSIFIVSKKALLSVRKGCKIEVEKGANFIVEEGGRLKIFNDSCMILHEGAKIIRSK